MTSVGICRSALARPSAASADAGFQVAASMRRKRNPHIASAASTAAEPEPADP